MASTTGGGDPNPDPNAPSVRRARGQSPASAHYSEGSGYLDRLTKREVDLGIRSGLGKRRRRRGSR